MAQGFDKRTHGRRRTIFGGVLYGQDGGSWECAIVDISESGAKIRAATDLKMGEKVDLKINKYNEFRTCEVIWLREGEVGVRFVVGLDPKREGLDRVLGLLKEQQ